MIAPLRKQLAPAIARISDAGMCAAMNLLQSRRAREASRPADLAAYLAKHRGVARGEHFAAPPMEGGRFADGRLEWESPLPCPHPENRRASALVFPAAGDPGAPAVIILHALMSASDIGYRRVAKWFNERGWTALFPHLPFHYSRVPRGTFNGELAITADLVRNAETLRRAVIETRQLLAWLRGRGAAATAVLGTSYGGWTAALASSLEPGLHFLALVQPIADVEAAIWENPGAAAMRAQLRRNGIGRGVSEPHARLVSPLHCRSLCPPDRIVLVSGLYDSVSTPRHLGRLARAWGAPRPVLVRQGHFGYAALPATLREIESRGLLSLLAEPGAGSHHSPG